jgi:hypothetical protein
MTVRLRRSQTLTHGRMLAKSNSLARCFFFAPHHKSVLTSPNSATAGGKRERNSIAFASRERLPNPHISGDRFAVALGKAILTLLRCVASGSADQILCASADSNLQVACLFSSRQTHLGTMMYQVSIDGMMVPFREFFRLGWQRFGVGKGEAEKGFRERLNRGR